MSAVSSSRSAHTEFDFLDTANHCDEQNASSNSTHIEPLHELSELLPLAESFISQSISTAEDQSPKYFPYLQQPLLGRSYTERVKVPLVDYSSKTRDHVTWSKESHVQEVPVLGTKRTFVKNIARAIPNPWRRYGALSTLCHIGGWITRTDRPDRKCRRYFYVKPGTADRHPPDQPKIIFKTSKYLPELKLPSNASVEEQAALAAVQLRRYSTHIKASKSDSAINSLNKQKYFDTTKRNDGDEEEIAKKRISTQ
uniref:Uncharacterized protein n=1 Tax=Ascaris lumbricoides TaxID=6252 RepID=A0A0M3ITQ3_ASCLU